MSANPGTASLSGTARPVISGGSVVVVVVGGVSVVVVVGVAVVVVTGGSVVVVFGAVQHPDYERYAREAGEELEDLHGRFERWRHLVKIISGAYSDDFWVAGGVVD